MRCILRLLSLTKGKARNSCLNHLRPAKSPINLSVPFRRLPLTMTTVVDQFGGLGDVAVRSVKSAQFGIYKGQIFTTMRALAVLQGPLLPLKRPTPHWLLALVADKFL